MNLFDGTGAVDGDVYLHLLMKYKGLEMENLWATGVCTLHMVVTCSEYDSYVIYYSFNDSFTEMQCNDSCYLCLMCHNTNFPQYVSPSGCLAKQGLFLFFF